jgi:ribonuclease P protein component
MSHSEDFRRTIRQGVRVGRSTVVLHADSSPSDEVRVGFVVSKAVGGAVLRNRVKRRLRHLAADRLADTPAGTRMVVRALPRSAGAATELRTDLPSAWASALRRLAERGKR